MRFKNSYAAAVAAAVAAVVFSAVFQPVQAAPILIDNFTTGITGTTVTSNTLSTLNPSVGVSGSFGTFDFRDASGRLNQSSNPKSSRTVSVGVFNSGTGTLLLSSDGAGTGSISSAYAELYYSGPGVVDLTTGGNDAFQIKTGAGSNNNVVMRGYVMAIDNSGQYFATLPGNVFWAPNTTYNVPFSAFTGIDFTQLSAYAVGFAPLVDSSGGSVDLAGNVPFSSTATFTQISVVPEPTQIVLVAGVGAALGMWRLRKLRRNGAAAGDAIAS